jgi:hypothetical protein
VSFVPIQDAQCPERIPATRLAISLLELEMNPAWMRILQEPTVIGLLFRPDKLNGFLKALIRDASGRTEILQATQDVVSPARRE